MRVTVGRGPATVKRTHGICALPASLLLFPEREMRSSAALLALVPAVAPVPSGSAAPVAIRYNEAITHGFLVMKGPGGNTIAHGEFVQHPQGERVHNQLIFRFADGSLYEEAVTFTQRRVFRLMSYKLVQKGPSFPEA